jgi:hypothetical protein
MRGVLERATEAYAGGGEAALVPVVGKSRRQVEESAHLRASVLLCFRRVREESDRGEAEGGRGYEAVVGALQPHARRAFENYSFSGGRDAWSLILQFYA